MEFRVPRVIPRWLKVVAPVFLGAVAGYAYYATIGCVSGTKSATQMRGPEPVNQCCKWRTMRMDALLLDRGYLMIITHRATHNL